MHFSWSSWPPHRSADGPKGCNPCDTGLSRNYTDGIPTACATPQLPMCSKVVPICEPSRLFGHATPPQHSSTHMCHRTFEVGL